jgi:hypothetical protein
MTWRYLMKKELHRFGAPGGCTGLVGVVCRDFLVN